MQNLDNVYVYDIECDNLLESATKIHCLSTATRDKNTGILKIYSTTDYEAMKRFFLNPKIKRVGHNITFYDELVITKLLGIDTIVSKDRIMDTLALSQYLYPERLKHGLESWGIDLGIKKPEIKDWENLTSDEYIHRCEEDVKINMVLWDKCIKDLYELYENSEHLVLRIMNYLQFKLDCVREQMDEPNRLRLDIPHIEATLTRLKAEKEIKTKALEAAMPQVAVVKTKTYKDVLITDDGDFYERGDMMYEHLFREGHRPVREHKVEIITGYKDPNANSPEQKKAWLFSLGWKPEYYKNSTSKKTGETKKVPQISGKDSKDGSVCNSIVKLFSVEPALTHLEGLSVISHRISLLEGLLRDQKNGHISASMAGLTNTLRLKHKYIVNLPGINKPYGKDIRGSIIAEDGGILCGSDMSSLEDTTKQHYIYSYDPKYVQEMRVPGFDPHKDVAVLSGLMTKDEANFHGWYKNKCNK